MPTVLSARAAGKQKGEGTSVTFPVSHSRRTTEGILPHLLLCLRSLHWFLFSPPTSSGQRVILVVQVGRVPSPELQDFHVIISDDEQKPTDLFFHCRLASELSAGIKQLTTPPPPTPLPPSSSVWLLLCFAKVFLTKLSCQILSKPCRAFLPFIFLILSFADS